MNYNDSDAYVILFCGKTGDGKSTAINAFFNIIKGIELEDNYRFILVTEPKKAQGQAESQTDGVHLYYLKDKDNKPVIIIDSQGYGDTRGKKYDEMVNDAFRYVFTNVIDHINTVCFIAKSNTNRLDILTRYIFSMLQIIFLRILVKIILFQLHLLIQKLWRMVQRLFHQFKQMLII